MRFEVDVDTTGRATACRVIESSGHTDLDEAACNTMQRRARFDPARGAAGEAVPGTWTSGVNFMIPE